MRVACGADSVARRPFGTRPPALRHPCYADRWYPPG